MAGTEGMPTPWKTSSCVAKSLLFDSGETFLISSGDKGHFPRVRFKKITSWCLKMLNLLVFYVKLIQSEVCLKGTYGGGGVFFQILVTVPSSDHTGPVLFCRPTR